MSKVIGVGIAKTGTTTLASCLYELGYTNHKSFDRKLKYQVEAGDIRLAMKVAEKYDSFEDSPWYLIYKELDKKFPGSKFILTVRKDPLSQAKSNWHHGVRTGERVGEPTEEYINEKIRFYNQHVQDVEEYFKDRPDDLLIVCWENGDGWEKLCDFLDLPIPSAPFPKSNVGTYKSEGWLKHFLYNDRRASMFRKVRYFFAKSSVVRTLLRRQ